MFQILLDSNINFENLQPKLEFLQKFIYYIKIYSINISWFFIQMHVFCWNFQHNIHILIILIHLQCDVVGICCYFTWE
jgi:hypothetical protein